MIWKIGSHYSHVAEIYPFNFNRKYPWGIGRIGLESWWLEFDEKRASTLKLPNVDLPQHFFLCSMVAGQVEKALATHSSTLAWKIPWTEEPGGLQSMGSRDDWATSLSLFTFMHWRRKWQPTPVFLPGESQGRGSLVGCCLWGCTESDTTDVT